MSRGAAIFDLDRTLLAPPSSERAFFRFLISGGRVPPLFLLRAALGGLRALPEGWVAVTKRNKAMWAGWDSDELSKEARRCFDEVLQRRIYREARGLIAEHRRRGDLIILLSGTLDVLLDPFAEYFEVDASVSTRLERSGGRITGRIEGLHPYGPGKRAVLDHLLAQHGLDAEASTAYADHLSDVGLMSGVGSPVATNPGPELARVADRLGWQKLHLTLAA